MPSPNDDLVRFVDHARERGLDHATVRQVLLSAGWRDGEIARVICARDLELPIPEPPRATAAGRASRRSPSPWPRRAREAFLHLLAFGALFTWVTSLVLLVFSCIDLALPDPAWRTTQPMLDVLHSIMRVQVATIVVAYPVFLFLWHFLLREVRRDPEKGRGAIRRWLAYLALFVGAITLVADVMTLIYFMLEGQLTLRFMLKSGALLVVAGGLVWYLATTLRSEAGAAP